MKIYSIAAALVLFGRLAFCQDHPPFIYETAAEFLATADFDGNGRADVVIVDKNSGKFRLGYQDSAGKLTWVDNRVSGIKGISGFTIGKLLTNTFDALAFTSPDAGQITLINASSPTSAFRPTVVPFDAALGPSAILAVDVGGEGNTSLADFYVASIYNSPDPNMLTLLRNDLASLPKVSESILPGVPGRANRLSVKPGQPDLACVLLTDEKGVTLRAEELSTGKPVAVLNAGGLTAGTEYVLGHFRKKPAPELLLFTPGNPQLSVRTIEQSAQGQLQLGASASFQLEQPIRQVVSLYHTTGPRLFVSFGQGEKGAVFDFDGVKAPVLVQTLVATNELFTGAAALPEGLVTFSHSEGAKFTTRYQSYTVSASKYNFTAYGSLPTLADNDNVTIPDIHDRLLNQLSVKSEKEMLPYTNNIPGTPVTFVMVPIPGGEFVMGSPDSEPGRKPDESPQHKVRISPFWMGQCEVTWNEYELFMYPDEERRTRATMQTDAAGDKLADAVTHPSKPYVEMSFGMGKDNYPAISMTQHGANKYCQWLSAKTGQFYRLPTEAEWEYACRAGTTTAYFFGEDASKIGDYAWFEENSDFKYQKVRKKKANPWGLYDIYGNVVEWVLDQYDPAFYAQCAAKPTTLDPWNRATKPYPHSVRGGSWDDNVGMCRSAARRGSDRAWKMQDPQLPKSIWYQSDAQWVGFRIVRPLVVPPPEQLQKYWTSGVERD